MSTLYPYRADSQIEKYIAQFIRAMSGFQVKESGLTEDLKRVPVFYGAMHRIVGSVLQRRDSFTNNSLPLLAVNLSGIVKNEERKVSHHHRDDLTFESQGTTHSSSRISGPPMILQLDLSIYASSTRQLFEIFEQIALIYNPRITIQVDNDLLNSDYITEIEMTSINNEIQYPLGTEQQVVMQSLSFEVPVRIRYPYLVGDNIIQEIRNKIFDESGDNVVQLDELVVTGE